MVAGLGYPYAGKTAQAGESRFNLNLSKNERKDVNFSNLISKGYGQGVHPGAGYDNGNQYGGLFYTFYIFVSNFRFHIKLLDLTDLYKIK